MVQTAHIYTCKIPVIIMSTTRPAVINGLCDGELLGLNTSNTGCSCEQHECCGKMVKHDDVIRFKLVAVVEDRSGKPFLEMIKGPVLIEDGTEICTVGFLSREVAALPSQRLRYVSTCLHRS